MNSDGMGRRVRELRHQANLTLAELATLAGVGNLNKKKGGGATISYWELGGSASAVIAGKVADALAGKLKRGRAELLAYIVWG